MTEKSLAKPFEPMLASPRGEHRFPCIVQPKYDGIRCVVRGGVALSRNLEPIANSAIRATLAGPLFEGFDGELVYGDPTAKDCYNATQDVAMDRNASPQGVVFNVFDDFTDPRQPYVIRLYSAAARLEAYASWGIMTPVPSLWAEDEAELMQLAEHHIGLGWEGVIVRDPHAIYKHGRATEAEGSLWKIKQFVDDEMLITGCAERMHNTNEATLSAKNKTKRSHKQEGKVGTGLLGVLIGTSPKWPGQEIRIGSSNLPRIPMADAVELFVGKLVTFKHQPAGAKDLPRFPIFKAIRDARDMGKVG